jgi:hypothetical protein
MTDILGIYLNQKYEEGTQPSPITGWRFLLARVICPDCDRAFSVCPVLGNLVVCPECRGVGVILYGPAIVAQDKPSICAAYLLMETGTQSWLFHPSYVDFPPNDEASE